jgi:acetylornithine deacetylase/succinyl-diaminopimelate desuccinylase-like protein
MHAEGWSEGLHPCTPVVRGTKLYGRGSADDGYAPFACLMAIKAAREQGQALPRVCVVPVDRQALHGQRAPVMFAAQSTS